MGSRWPRAAAREQPAGVQRKQEELQEVVQRKQEEGPERQQAVPSPQTEEGLR